MAWLAPKLVGRIPIASLANPPALVELFAETIVEELDFRLEAANGKRIAQAATLAAVRHDIERAIAAGVPFDYEEHVTLMYELMTLAYQADVTRVISFMVSREVTARTYPQVGVFGHVRNDTRSVQDLDKPCICRYGAGMKLYNTYTGGRPS